MDIRGLLPVSLIEFPGRISSVVFTGGCNLRCPFCHNKDLVIGLENTDKISEEELLGKINDKKEWIDAVCFTGGEPTLNVDLPEFFKKIKSDFGLEIMVETNGTNPEMVEKLIKENLIDFIAMDIKAPFEDYKKLGASKENIENIKKSIAILKNIGDVPRDSAGILRGEFRITTAPEIVTLENIEKIGQQIKGAKKVFLQKFRQDITLDPAWEEKKPYEDDVLEKMKDVLKGLVEEVEIR